MGLNIKVFIFQNTQLSNVVLRISHEMDGNI